MPPPSPAPDRSGHGEARREAAQRWRAIVRRIMADHDPAARAQGGRFVRDPFDAFVVRLLLPPASVVCAIPSAPGAGPEACPEAVIAAHVQASLALLRVEYQQERRRRRARG